MSLSVANSEPVTVGSRVAGFVTNGPTMIRSVAASICEWMTYGSCHRMCESNVQACVKPRRSARWVSSTTRLAGGSVWKVTPKSMRVTSSGRPAPRSDAGARRPAGLLSAAQSSVLRVSS